MSKSRVRLAAGQRKHREGRGEGYGDDEQQVVDECRESAEESGFRARRGFFIHAGADIKVSVLVLLADALLDRILVAA